MYTMHGDNTNEPEARGIVPRTAVELFDRMTMLLRMWRSYTGKIQRNYMEQVHDLLDKQSARTRLDIREDT